jgi:hypothetical protein
MTLSLDQELVQIVVKTFLKRMDLDEYSFPNFYTKQFLKR